MGAPGLVLWLLAAALLPASPLQPATVQAATPDFSVTTSNIFSWQQSDWSLTARFFIPGHFQSRLAVANGYVGASVAAAGPFFEQDVNETDPAGTPPTNGWPLYDPRIAFSTISGFWNVQKNASGTNYPWLTQHGWDSFIAGIPHPTAIVFAFRVNGTEVYLDATVGTDEVQNFEQRLRMQTGEVEWSYTWAPAGLGIVFNVTFAVLFSRARPNVVAVKATLTPSADIAGSVTDLLDGRSAVRSYAAATGANSTAATIFSSVHPNGLTNVTGWLVSIADFPGTSYAGPAQGSFVSVNKSTIGQKFDMTLEAGTTATFHKFVGVASTDKFPEAELTAFQAARSAKGDGWDVLLTEQTSAWRALMTDASIDNYTDPSTGLLPSDPDIQVLQVGSVASTYYLLQNLLPDDGSGLNDNSISVGGLASDSYAGQVFWDADTWMAPGLNLAFPSYARQIPNYRVKLHAQALANAAFNGYPEGSSLYSWTAGRYGNCTASGPCVDYEYHLNYDLAFNMLQLRNVTANDTWFDNGPLQVVLSTAAMTANLLQWNETTESYWLKNATDPDEYANNVDNPSFTIASAAALLTQANDLLVSKGKQPNGTWAYMAANVALPRAASNITLEYLTMNNSVVVKQADVVLLTYPLGHTQSNYTEDNSLLDLDYYSVKQAPDGPAMTFGVYAAVANAVSPSGCAAYTFALKSFLPYLRAPWYQFSEQEVDDPLLNGGTNPAFPFLTGHGGAIQIAPFGFLGLQTDQDVLFINPSLPPQIPHLRVRKFYFDGAAFVASLNRTHTTITRVPAADTAAGVNATRDESGAAVVVVVGSPRNASSQSRYTLAVNKTVTVPNRLYWQAETYADNILQCAPVTTSDTYVPGQVPQGANDGAAATAWQPELANTSATIVVDTRHVEARELHGVYFDFGARPVANAIISLWNDSSYTPFAQFASENVTVTIEVPTVLQLMGLGPNLASPGSATVLPVVDNTTTVDLTGQGVWSGDWVKLVVTGCAGCSEQGEEGGTGGTVNEFVLF